MAESREALVVGRLCDKRPFSDADPTMATISNQNTADRLSDVIDEGDAIISPHPDHDPRTSRLARR